MDRWTELNNKVLAGGVVNPAHDGEALKAYFQEHVNPNTVFFHDLEEKVRSMTERGLWDAELLARYRPEDVKAVFTRAYRHGYRFQSFMGAQKFYAEYATKTPDGSRYLERYEDRMSMVALARAGGDAELALTLVDHLVQQTFVPATPTLMNSGKANTGRLTSCFLLQSCTDSLDSIMKTQHFAADLSKNGGGVGIDLSNLRARGEDLRGLKGVTKGAAAVAKLFDVLFRYADQAGQRQGAAVVNLSVMHPDFQELLAGKKIATDEDARLKTLSVCAVIPDVFMQAVRDDQDVYQVYPRSYEQATGRVFTDIDWEREYADIVANSQIRKRRVSARQLLQEIALTQGESGYPYLLFTGNANRANPVPNVGTVKMTNLCVTGETRLLTNEGYIRADELYRRGGPLRVVVDERARTMNLAATGVREVESTPMHLTARQAEVFRLQTAEGFRLRATAWHKMYVVRDGTLLKIPLADVVPGDRVPVQPEAGAFGKHHDPQGAVMDAATFPGTVPDFLWNSNAETVHAYLTELGAMPGEPGGLCWSHSDPDFLADVQLLLLNLGLYARLEEGTLRVTQGAHDGLATVLSVTPDGREDVYDVTVEDGHSVIFNGISTGQCSEIMQPTLPSHFHGYGQEARDVVGLDVSCNLASLHISNALASGDLGGVVRAAIHMLDDVARSTNIEEVPAVARANREMRSIGLGAMNLHGHLAAHGLSYGSPEALAFCDLFFEAVHFHARRTSMEIAKGTGFVFRGFEGSHYHSGEFFRGYTEREREPSEGIAPEVRAALQGAWLPTREDWRQLVRDIQRHGLAHSHVMAVAPTGSISYVAHATASVMPITEKVETRTSGKGKTIYPMPGLSPETEWYYEEAYDLDQRRVIDTVATIQRHVDQGISCTLFVKSNVTTADLAQLYIYAYRKGLKSLYYLRQRRTAVQECVACAV
ncbi:ribonucleotide reductase N-terminal alpha domain-containing protein [Deinococcus sp. RL]|uniref:ribonucleotide reductase N-terminal alpha domain-containing protein n=1 Tax=Deinococcus sp. RL TaxID=1489678 RepID=UPI0009E076E2|nr:ribonucleotide reductase N-terminal alpha domain-containing protein [Deinococcus sp. RL]